MQNLSGPRRIHSISKDVVSEVTRIQRKQLQEEDEVHSDIQRLHPGQNREGSDSPEVAKAAFGDTKLATRRLLARRRKTCGTDKTLQRFCFELYLGRTLPCI